MTWSRSCTYLCNINMWNTLSTLANFGSKVTKYITGPTFLMILNGSTYFGLKFHFFLTSSHPLKVGPSGMPYLLLRIVVPVIDYWCNSFGSSVLQSSFIWSVQPSLGCLVLSPIPMSAFCLHHFNTKRGDICTRTTSRTVASQWSPGNYCYMRTQPKKGIVSNFL